MNFGTTEFDLQSISSNAPLGEELLQKFGEHYLTELGLRISRATGETERVTMRVLQVGNLVMKELHDEWIVKGNPPKHILTNDHSTQTTTR